MKTTSILFRIRTIDASRRSRPLSAVFGRTLSFGNAMGVKAAVYGLTAALLYVLPVAVLFSRSEGEIEVSRLLIDGSCVALYFLGLFVGANLVFDTTIAENQALLAFPITVDDLARLRALEAFSVLAKTSFFLLIPLVWMDLLLDGANLSTLASGLVVSQIGFSISYLFGIVSLLLILRQRPWIKPDRLFLGVFLASAWALVLVKQVHRFPRLAASLDLPFGIIGLTLERVSLARLVGSAVRSQAPSIVVFLLFTSTATCVGFLLFGAIRDLLYFLYRGEHVKERRRVPEQSERLPGGPLISYSVLCHVLHRFPARVQAAVAKDALLVIRNPSRAAQILVFVLVIWLAPRLWPGGDSSSGLLSGYVAGSFIVFKLLIDSIGLERGNIHLIRRLMPGRFEYLWVRIRSGIVVSGIVALPAAVLVISTGGGFGPVSTAVSRLILMAANVLLSIVLVTGYSAVFARFDSGGFTAGVIGISPVAMLAYWAAGIWGPVLFLNLDRWILQDSTRAGWTALACVGPALVLTIVFIVLGDLRIRGIE